MDEERSSAKMSGRGANPPPLDLELPPLRNIPAEPASSTLRDLQPSHLLVQRSPSLPRAPPILSHPSPAHYPAALPPHAAMGSPLPPPMQQPQYYGPQGQPLPPPPHLALPHDPTAAPLRYPLPAPDGRMLSGGRHKKEIKRRTKTGCLTCRKRRIKCDEGHPTCRNCQKSKRECLGYDPIFKSQPGPAAIQPAPNATPPTAMQPSSTASSMPYALAVPAAYEQAVAGPFEPSLTTAQGAAPPPVPPPAFADYTAIDPALEAAGARPLPGEFNPKQDGLLTAPPVNIEDILNVGSGMPPPTIAAAPNLEPLDRDKIKQIFESLYAPACDKFLETRWFSARGLSHLLNNPLLLEKYRVLLSRFGYTAATNYHENLVTQSLEAHVIWETFLLARQVSASINSTNDPNAAIEANEGVHDAAKRVEVFEALVTNQKLDPANAIPDVPPGQLASAAGKPALDDQLKSRERDFWRYTSTFCVLKDDSKRSSENPNDEIDRTIREMRLLLDSRENRDIMYSIAIARHVGHKLAERASNEGIQAESTVGKPVGNNEEDPETKVSVARNFIQSESAGKGTTQVAQRVCGMALMAWSKR